MAFHHRCLHCLCERRCEGYQINILANQYLANQHLFLNVTVVSEDLLVLV